MWTYVPCKHQGSIKKTMHANQWHGEWITYHTLAWQIIVDAVSSLISGFSIVYSTVCLGADQRKHQRYALLAIVRRIHRDQWIPRTEGQ